MVVYLTLEKRTWTTLKIWLKECSGICSFQSHTHSMECCHISDFKLWIPLKLHGVMICQKSMYLFIHHLSSHRALSGTRSTQLDSTYAVCIRPFWHSQQERLVCTAAVQPASDGLYQVGMSIRAYCLTMILCTRPRPHSNQLAGIRVGLGLNDSQSLMDGNFAALWPTDPKLPVWKDLNPLSK